MTNMSRGRGTPWYGKLMTDTLPSEVKTIWYSRDEELPELPQHKWSWELQDDMEQVEAKDLLFKILADAPLTDREMLAIKLIVHDELTLKEAGHELGCTQERARQIYLKGMRKLRRRAATITGINATEVYGEVTTWSYWKWRNDKSNFGIDEHDEHEEFVWNDNWWSELTSSKSHEDQELVAWFYQWRGSRPAEREVRT